MLTLKWLKKLIDFVKSIAHGGYYTSLLLIVIELSVRALDVFAQIKLPPAVTKTIHWGLLGLLALVVLRVVYVAIAYPFYRKVPGWITLLEQEIDSRPLLEQEMGEYVPKIADKDPSSLCEEDKEGEEGSEEENDDDNDDTRTVYMYLSELKDKFWMVVSRVKMGTIRLSEANEQCKELIRLTDETFRIYSNPHRESDVVEYIASEKA